MAAMLQWAFVVVERSDFEALTDHAVLGGADPFPVERMRGLLDPDLARDAPAGEDAG